MGSGIASQSCAQQVIYHAQRTAVGNKLETFAARRLFLFLWTLFIHKINDSHCHVMLHWGLQWSASFILCYILLHLIQGNGCIKIWYVKQNYIGLNSLFSVSLASLIWFHICYGIAGPFSRKIQSDLGSSDFFFIFFFFNFHLFLKGS